MHQFCSCADLPLRNRNASRMSQPDDYLSASQLRAKVRSTFACIIVFRFAYSSRALTACYRWQSKRIQRYASKNIRGRPSSFCLTQLLRWILVPAFACSRRVRSIILSRVLNNARKCCIHYVCILILPFFAALVALGLVVFAYFKLSA